jgi:hypothetical protein
VKDLTKYSFNVEIQVRYPVESQAGEWILAASTALAGLLRGSKFCLTTS